MKPHAKVRDRRKPWRLGVVVRRAALPTAWVVQWFGNVGVNVAPASALERVPYASGQCRDCGTDKTAATP